MQIQDMQKFGGFVDIEVIRDGRNGPKVIKRERSHNLVINSGKKQILRCMCGLQTNDFDQFRIGTSGAAATSGDTNVLSPVTGTLVTADSKTLLLGTRSLQFIVSYPSGVGSISANAIQEVCLLNQNTSPGGSAAMRCVFSSTDKTTADKLKITYTLRAT